MILRRLTNNLASEHANFTRMISIMVMVDFHRQDQLENASKFTNLNDFCGFRCHLSELMKPSGIALHVFIHNVSHTPCRVYSISSFTKSFTLTAYSYRSSYREYDIFVSIDVNLICRLLNSITFIVHEMYTQNAVFSSRSGII